MYNNFSTSITSMNMEQNIFAVKSVFYLLAKLQVSCIKFRKTKWRVMRC